MWCRTNLFFWGWVGQPGLQSSSFTVKLGLSQRRLALWDGSEMLQAKTYSVPGCQLSPYVWEKREHLGGQNKTMYSLFKTWVFLSRWWYHVFKPNTQWAEACGSLHSRSTWSTEWLLGQSELHIEILSWTITPPNERYFNDMKIMLSWI